MISTIYQLVSPRTLSTDFREIDDTTSVLIRPRYMSVCQADQRYMQGRRPQEVLRKKLPMALIHEAVGTVVLDRTGNYQVGQAVAMVPNIAGPGRPGIYENYTEGSRFLSSGYDGFMREIVDLPPDRVVPIPRADAQTSLTELCSVSYHAIRRYEETAHDFREHIGVWGDGPVGYLTATLLKHAYPDLHVSVIGRHSDKLAYFTLVDRRYVTEELPSEVRFDHVFECTGGTGAENAVEQAIEHIRAQGTIILMGVSENPIDIDTRMVLEKGLTLVGASRSGLADFERAAQIWRDPQIANQIGKIVYEDEPVRSIDDIFRAFNTDLVTPFKTAFKWEL